jgi:hypothetical protein
LEEEAYLENHKFKNCGVEYLRKRISEIQYEKIKDNIPNIIQDIDNEILNLKNSSNFLTDLLSNNTSQIAKKLKVMIEKLVGSSLERAEFELNLEGEIRSVIQNYFKEVFEKKPLEIIYSTKSVNPYMLKYNSNKVLDANKFKKDSFKPLLSSGIIAPIFVDNFTLKKSLKNEKMLYLAIQMIDLQIDDPLGKKRLAWFKYIDNYFSQLLKDDFIHNKIFEITQKLLNNYISTTETDDSIKKFTQFLIKEVSLTAFQENIKYSITAFLNIEKRPNVSLTEILRYFITVHPEAFSFNGKMFELLRKEKRKIVLEVYSEEWNDAYLKAVLFHLKKGYG